MKWLLIALLVSATAAAQDKVPASDRDPARFTRYNNIIAEASQQYRIPEDLIRAIIKTESDYDPRVVSRANAKGLMQLMPDEVRRFGITDPFDPRQNIMGGTRLLRENANRYCDPTGRYCNPWLAIAAYHGGHAGVARQVAKYGGLNPVTNPRTHYYVRTVSSRWLRGK